MEEKVCLAITTFNRNKQLFNSLSRLCNLTKPDDILLVNDGGEEESFMKVFNYFKDRLPIRYIYNHNPTWSLCSFSRNIAIKNTDCDILIFSEPELLFIDDTITQLLEEYYSNTSHMITAGVIYHQQEWFKHKQPPLEENPRENLKKSRVKLNSRDGTIALGYDYSQVLNWQAPYIAIYNRNNLLEIGGYDESFTGEWGAEDWDMCTRLRIKCRINQIISSKIEVVHQWHPTLPPNVQARALKANETAFFDKKLSVDGIEDRNNPNLVANQGKEWGIIKTK